ncbi:MAG: histidine--tRNA ligase [Salinivirgaceae bacterium]|jgi:histidyl-tRNA synthetase|nr:histidine--tRNA ligase [Salinivirgaceae bacterium]
MAQKVSIPKGTRDFSPLEMARRNYIFETIRDVYKLYGFQPIETPSMELLSTLMGKYGEEGDKLLFKILNSGDFAKKANPEHWNTKNINKLTSQIAEKGLRYDLTVPFARYVVQNRNDITFPFKRFQIQPVWRADRPQKGRYREFMQCDADVIGSNALVHEAELVMIIDEVFKRLGINVTVKLNSRKLLTAIAELVGKPELITAITVSIDKLDKIGIDKVREELIQAGLTSDDVEKVIPIIELKGSNAEKLNKLVQLFESNEAAVEGKKEIDTVLAYLKNYDMTNDVEFDLALARGLNYYTGCIIEVKANDAQMGSICGGGRYDDLTGIFGLKDVSGVGISFGADRIYDVLEQLDKFPETTLQGPTVMLVNFGEKEMEYAFKAAIALRKAGIAAEVYPDQVKMKKQMNYANAKNFPYVIMVGENEINDNTYTLKNMTSGEQSTSSLNDVINQLSN